MVDDPWADLPYDDDVPDHGITARQALVNLLNAEASLTDEQWEFVSGCAGFIRLSPKQEQALIATWQHVELQVALKRARLYRKKRRRQSNGGASSR